MKVPQFIKNTDQFNKLRTFKHNLDDSISIFKYIVHNRIFEKKDFVDVLSEEEIDNLNLKIIEENNNQNISFFSDNTPFISVIISNYDTKYLSILLDYFSSDEDYPNFEIIVVDMDNNTASSVVNNYESLSILILSGENYVSLNNIASHKANGDYLLFLDSSCIVFQGLLSKLMNIYLSKKNIGILGVHQIDPDCTNTTHENYSYKTESEGFYFKVDGDYIEPFYKNHAKVVSFDKNNISHVIGVPKSCLFIKKSIFMEEEFSEKYSEKYMDIDLSLKLYKKGYENYVTSSIKIYHKPNNCINNNDHEVFHKLWDKYIYGEFYQDKINSNNLFSDKPLTVAFVVTQSDANTTAGDYFTALTLAKNIKSFGWNIKYLSQNSNDHKNWYFIDADIDVVISLLDRYNLNKIYSKNSNLVTIAWLRNWFERWTDQSYFDNYDIILASSKKSCDFIEEKTLKKAHLYPLATDPSMFNQDICVNQDYICDYCFTGSYWGSNRDIIQCLNPDELDYTFNLYGINWEHISKLKDYIKGFVSYEQIPEVYSSTKIVLDDANHVTREFGSVNSRVFDTLASGKLVLTNGSIGNEELFNGKIPEYHSESELKSKLRYYLENQNIMEEKISQLQKIVLEKHTYQSRANTLRKILYDYYIEK